MNLTHIMLSEKSVDSKDYILYDSIYMMFWERQNCRDTKQINDCLGLRGLRKFVGAGAGHDEIVL